MKDIHDLIVLGGGPAGRTAAIIARRTGASVLLVEQGPLGGTCPLRGCIPKKVLVTSAEIMDDIGLAQRHRVATGEVCLDWNGLISRKREILAPIPEGYRTRLDRLGLGVLAGQARFAGPNSIEVEGRVFHAKKIVIATGSKPRGLPIPGFEHALTSDRLLELDEKPSSAVFIGSGPIGMEFAHVMVRSGVEVTVLDAARRILPAFDQDLVERLVSFTRGLGVRIHTGVEVDSIVPKGSGFQTVFRQAGESLVIESDIVINSAGRVADLEDLDLKAAGVETDARGNLVLDSYLRSVSNPDVLAAGDAVSTSPQLSPVATYEGRIAAANATSAELKAPEYRVVPFVVYTIPSLASVGLSEQEAQARGAWFTVKTRDLASLRLGQIHAEQAAMSKVLVEEGTGLILGAHILGHGAQDLINIFGLAMRHGITSRDLRGFLFAFPTFSSDIPNML
ncbi:MAG: NAD(P)/FAD-dependent oxidoreductase [Desulfomonilia bacterium]